jgi:hypothetical protein
MQRRILSKAILLCIALALLFPLISAAPAHAASAPAPITKTLNSALPGEYDLGIWTFRYYRAFDASCWYTGFYRNYYVQYHVYVTLVPPAIRYEYITLWSSCY